MGENGQWYSNDHYCDVWGPPVYQSNSAARFGWWAIGNDGSQQKTGEYQDLDSSPFWDVDLISSNRVRTLNLILSGLDNETSDAHVDYYGVGASGRLDFERYIHRLDHKPLTGLDIPPGQVPPPGPEGNVISNDLNVGEDYAIRVEELDAKYQGRWSDSVTWRMNVWSQRKFGDRQVNATAHCFNMNAPAPAGATGNVCHVLSQRQSIDWRTVEVQPVIEARLNDATTVEYSHTIRGFGSDDELVTRQYTRFNGFSPANEQLGPPYAYALVPDSLTNIDRLKVASNLSDYHKVYANLYVGTTENQLRDMQRDFNGYDLRLTNTLFDPVTFTGYASRYAEDTDYPPFFLTTPPLAPTPTPPNPSYDQTSLREPIDYTRTRAGIKANWQPFGDRGPRSTNYGIWEGTSLASGYEYYLLERDFATYRVRPNPPGSFTQPNTTTNQLEFGPSTRWSKWLDTFVRYRLQFIENPLVGISEYSNDDPDVNGTFNTSLPEQVHNVDLGYTWTPYSNFMTTAQFTIRNSWNESAFANFTEDNYPFSFTAWYAATERLFFTGGYAYFANWIDQDITLGANRGIPTDTETTRWNYTGENHLFTFNVNYAVTPDVQLLGGVEWDRGMNYFGVPPSPNPGVDWSLLPFLSDVLVETTRLTTGVNWQPYQDMNVYLRYVFFDYNDISSNLDSGSTHMVLAGATRTW